jgi:hypothetical protein
VNVAVAAASPSLIVNVAVANFQTIK